MQTELTAKEVKNLAQSALYHLEANKGPGTTAQILTVRKILNMVSAISPQKHVVVTADDFQWLTEGIPASPEKTNGTKPSFRKT